MRSQVLDQTGITTSALGFGCVQLTSHATRSDAIRILGHAFDCGITHFDVARAYGFGRAEGILAEFLQGKRDRVTVATKLGLLPPSGISGNRRVIDTVKRVLGPFPSLLRRAKRHGEKASSQDFSPGAAVQSLHTSLRQLRTDYVDVLLLHEATVADASNSALLDALQKEVASGKIRSLGIASEFSKVARDVGLLPHAYKIVQFNDDAVERNPSKLADRQNRALITHSIFKPAQRIHAAAEKSPQMARDFSARVGANPCDVGAIRSLLLHYALWSNHAGVVLFSSTNPDHITANTRVAESPIYDAGQIADFLRFVDEIFALNAAAQPSSAVPGMK